MGTKKQKLMSVLLLSLSIGLVGGSPAFARSCVDFTSKMKMTFVDLEDKIRQKEIQGPIRKPKTELKGPLYIDCGAKSRKALSGTTEKK